VPLVVCSPFTIAHSLVNYKHSLRQGLKINCVAVINDTTGTLVACAHKDQQCHIGLILGTGCNACYMEKAEKVQQWDEEIGDSDEVFLSLLTHITPSKANVR